MKKNINLINNCMPNFKMLFVCILIISGCSSLSNKGSANKKILQDLSTSIEKNNINIEKCVQPLGTLSILESKSNDWAKIKNANEALPLFNYLMQETNCFIVFEDNELEMLSTGGYYAKNNTNLAMNLYFQPVAVSVKIVVA